MQFTKPLLKGTLLKRYKRFLADIELDNGEMITAHCANSGALLGVKDPGIPVWLSESENPNRKLKYTWEMAEVDQVMVCVNTSWPNVIAAEAIQSQVITELNGYTHLKREVKYGQNSRLDILLQDPAKVDCFVEIKSVHVRRDASVAEFPDAVTTRGAKHLSEMVEVVREGKRGVMLYVVQRNDCECLKFAADIDPVYAKTAAQAKTQGVEFYAYYSEVSPNGIIIKAPIPVIF
ncbi:DNA/RNA nuclease SfsA [Candidatus Paracaedibacter symbiosus]|uniref:DNA/RNA nuclease SfsA n=1 Tax=Candidatus Paracaedibacter symbiosus TaxID=244582 RepID=UPI0005095ACB|nr:DNA/RNA nuclease SfsA [Candidatus Paracaedibacter symbiosus]